MSHFRCPVGIWAPTPRLETALSFFIFTSPAVLAHCCTIHSCYLQPCLSPVRLCFDGVMGSCLAATMQALSCIHLALLRPSFRSKWVKDVLERNQASGRDFGGVPTTENYRKTSIIIHQYILYLVVTKIFLSIPFTTMPCLQFALIFTLCEVQCLFWKRIWAVLDVGSEGPSSFSGRLLSLT